MLRGLTKAIRRWIEKRNNKPRVLYADRSMLSEIMLCLLYIYAAILVIGSVIALFDEFIYIYPVCFLNFDGPYSFVIAIIFGFVMLFLWILLEFFDITFDDLITIIILYLVFFFALSSVYEYIGSSICYFISIVWNVIMFFYICPRKFFRVYSDYNLENS